MLKEILDYIYITKLYQEDPSPIFDKKIDERHTKLVILLNELIIKHDDYLYDDEYLDIFIYKEHGYSLLLIYVVLGDINYTLIYYPKLDILCYSDGLDNSLKESYDNNKVHYIKEMINRSMRNLFRSKL